MILPTDLPTRAQLEGVLAVRDPSSVSIYLPTSPFSRGQAERIELKNLAGEAARQLQGAGAGRGEVAAIDDELTDPVGDDEFFAAFNGLDVALILAAVLDLRREDILGKSSVAATLRHAA